MEQCKVCLFYLLTYTQATAELGHVPSLRACSISPRCAIVTLMGAGAFAATSVRLPRPREVHALFAMSTLILPQSLAIKETTSN